MVNESISLRPATPQDNAAIAAVINANSLDVSGTKRALIDQNGQLRVAYNIPSFAEKVVAVTSSGRIVGFLYHSTSSPYVIHAFGGAVHPDYHRQGIGTMLLQWARQRGSEFLQLAPDGAKVVLTTLLFEQDHLAQTLFRYQGYRPVREWVHFETRMAQCPSMPVLPDGITIRQMDQSHDWPAVGDALEEAFRDHWGEMKPTPDAVEAPAVELDDEDTEAEEDDEDDPYFNSRAFCFVAWDGDQVAGSCLGNESAIEWPDSGKIGSLSVRRPYRRLGIGRALTLYALGRFYEQGIQRVITDTDANGFTGAYRLYQQAGMHIYRREVTYEKELRPGKELRLLSPEI